MVHQVGYNDCSAPGNAGKTMHHDVRSSSLIVNELLALLKVSNQTFRLAIWDGNVKLRDLRRHFKVVLVDNAQHCSNVELGQEVLILRAINIAQV